MAKEYSLGIYGLGKMGRGIALQMLERGYKITALNRSKPPLDEVVKAGAARADSVKDLVSKLKAVRVVWLMLPAGDVTEEAVNELASLLQKGDVVVDGSNSRYKDAQRRGAMLNKKGILFLDAGCSGGPGGARNGMSMMIGGDKVAYTMLEKLFKDLSVPNGSGYMGAAGSGHFVKMVHNAIEYGMMQSIAEGMELVADGPYKDLDMSEVVRVWSNGSVIRSFLVELAGRALSKDSKLDKIAPFVEDTGEGRWAVEAAVEYGVPFTAISHSLYNRFKSRSQRRFADRLLAALRHEFGGHAVKEE